MKPTWKPKPFVCICNRIVQIPLLRQHSIDCKELDRQQHNRHYSPLKLALPLERRGGIDWRLARQRPPSRSLSAQNRPTFLPDLPPLEALKKRINEQQI
jgi:hypothetical protein